MKKILKEEYDKRINYFLNEKMTITDKRGVNYVKFAKGLKVLDQAGNQFSFDTIVKKGNEEFAKLYLPDEPREDAYGESSLNYLQEYDISEDSLYKRDNSGEGREIRDPNDDKDIEYLLDSEDEYRNYDNSEYDNEDEDNLPDYDLNIDDNSNSTPKLPDRKYILVPMGEFEQRFRLKTEE
jgi:hypothetical protein